jgi:hypothetical protein
MAAIPACLKVLDQRVLFFLCRNWPLFEEHFNHGSRMVGSLYWITET